MFSTKEDPALINSVKSVMAENDRLRANQKAVNEKYGIESRNALPNERVAEYDRTLADLNSGKKTISEMVKDPNPNASPETINKALDVDGYDNPVRKRARELMGKKASPETINKALAKEENLQEISPNLAREFLKKGRVSAKKLSDDWFNNDLTIPSDRVRDPAAVRDPVKSKKARIKMNKRENSIALAVAKLTGEPYAKHTKNGYYVTRKPKVLTKEENLQELSPPTLERYKEKAERSRDDLLGKKARATRLAQDIHSTRELSSSAADRRAAFHDAKFQSNKAANFGRKAEKRGKYIELAKNKTSVRVLAKEENLQESRRGENTKLGSPWERGYRDADAGQVRKPHYYRKLVTAKEVRSLKDATKISDWAMTDQQIAAYHRGYDHGNEKRAKWGYLPAEQAAAQRTKKLTRAKNAREKMKTLHATIQTRGMKESADE